MRNAAYQLSTYIIIYVSYILLNIYHYQIFLFYIIIIS